MSWFLLLACADPVPPPPMMKDLWRPYLRVNVGAPLGEPEAVRVYFHPEEIGGCQDIQSIRASFDGVPLTRLHGKVQEKGYDYDRDCNVFEFEAPLAAVAGKAAEGVSRVEVTDGEVTAVLEATDLTVTRRLVAASPGPYARGETVELRWEPAGATVDPRTAFGVKLRAQGNERLVGGAAVVVTPEAVRVTLPAELSDNWVGPVELDFVGTSGVQPTVRRCAWAVECAVNRLYTVPPVTITVK